MDKSDNIISSIVTPLDRLFNPGQYSTYSSTYGALHPVQVPALYVPASINPLTPDKFTKFDYEILMELDNKNTRSLWGIINQPEESISYFDTLDTLLNDEQEIKLMSEMVSTHPDIFFPILQRIRLLQKYDDISKYRINFKTYQNDYGRRTGLAALHSLTFETVAAWSSDFDKILKLNYSPKLVVVEENIDRLTEHISSFTSQYTFGKESNEREMIKHYAKDKKATLVVNVNGRELENPYLELIHKHWSPDAVAASGNEKDNYRPRAFIMTDEGIKKCGPIRQWFMNQEPIKNAYVSQYHIARNKQMLDREELRLFSPNHYIELAPHNVVLDNIIDSLTPKLVDEIIRPED